MSFEKQPIKLQAGYLKYGVLRSVVHYSLINKFYYPDRFKDTLSSYYLLYWSPNYIKEQIRDGMITCRGCEYSVIWHKIGPASLSTITQCKLSFRIPRPEYNLPAYVLIANGDISEKLL